MAKDDALTEMEKQVGELEKKLEAALKDGGAEKIAALTKDLDAAKKAADAAKTEIESLKAQNAELTAKGKMTPEELKAYNDMKDEDKKKFLEMQPEDRAKRMDEIKKGDESVTVEGQTIFKSKVGAEQFAIFKGMAERIAKQEKDIQKERDERQTVELTKRAEAELEHLPGEVAKKVEVLKAVASMPAEAQLTLNAMLKAGGAAIKAGFERIGSKGGDLPKETVQKAQDFEKKVAEIISAEKCSRTAALQKARTQNPELFAAYQESGAVKAN